jgi:protein phosphatase 2C-like protein
MQPSGTRDPQNGSRTDPPGASGEFSEPGASGEPEEPAAPGQPSASGVQRPPQAYQRGPAREGHAQGDLTQPTPSTPSSPPASGAPIGSRQRSPDGGLLQAMPLEPAPQRAVRVQPAQVAGQFDIRRTMVRVIGWALTRRPPPGAPARQARAQPMPMPQPLVPNLPAAPPVPPPLTPPAPVMRPAVPPRVGAPAKPIATKGPVVPDQPLTPTAGVARAAPPHLPLFGLLVMSLILIMVAVYFLLIFRLATGQVEFSLPVVVLAIAAAAFVLGVLLLVLVIMLTFLVIVRVLIVLPIIRVRGGVGSRGPRGAQRRAGPQLPGQDAPVSGHAATTLPIPRAASSPAGATAADMPPLPTPPNPAAAADSTDAALPEAWRAVRVGQRVERAPWLEIEPSDRRFPATPTQLLDYEDHGWAIVGASLRGKGHRQDGKYREDALAAQMVDGLHLIAVADGGGSYDLAREGARVAVEQAIAGMHDQCAAFQKAPPDDVQMAVEAILRAGLMRAYEGVHARANEIHLEDGKTTVDDLRSTLLLLVHRELPGGTHLVGGAQVGDGVIAVRDGENRLQLLGTPDTGAVGNEVVFLTDVSTEELARRPQAQTLPTRDLYCLVMTDGVSDDFLPIEENLAGLERPLFTSVFTPGHTSREAAARLVEVLGYDRPGSFDDRTLVCVYKIGSTPWM